MDMPQPSTIPTLTHAIPAVPAVPAVPTIPPRTWARHIAEEIQRHTHLVRTNPTMSLEVWANLYHDVLDAAPRGSGLDHGSTLLETSKPNRLMFFTSFHHMTEHGVYNGWTDHHIVVTPTFSGFDVKVHGSDRNGIKDYIQDVFWNWLSSTKPTQKAST